MRAIRNLTLLLALIAPAAFAESQYRVEMLLVRQNAVPAVTSQYAPEDWKDGAAPLASFDVIQPILDKEAGALAADNQYTVLLHKAWQQTLDGKVSKVAISDGQEQFGHFPIEGNVSLSEDRFITVDARFWVNQFDANGGVIQSEAFSQSNRNVTSGVLTFLDGGHLAVLFKVRKAGAPAIAPADPTLMEQ